MFATHPPARHYHVNVVHAPTTLSLLHLIVSAGESDPPPAPRKLALLVVLEC